LKQQEMEEGEWKTGWQDCTVMDEVLKEELGV
jgi:hypothetical protein